MTLNTLWVSLACVVMLTACGRRRANSTTTIPSDSGIAMTTDGGTSVLDMHSSSDFGTTVDMGTTTTDLGPRDLGAPDLGSSDPCASEDALSTVGCNGAPLGPFQPANEFGGRCDPSADVAQGSCNSTSAICGGNPGGVGLCVLPCDSAATYVSTGGCPSGSRCFLLSGGSICFPDCTSGADCVTGACDDEGSCTSPP